MPVTLQDIQAERQRRGITLQDVRAERARRDELALSSRERRGDVASRELGESRTPGFLDYVPGVGVLQDIPDIVSSGFNAPQIQARRARREEAARTLVPYATAALGGAAGAGVRGLGLVGRAIGAGLGSGAGDVAGQAVTQRGSVDPTQAIGATLGGAVGQPIGEALGAAAPAVARRLLRGGEAGRRGVQEAIADAGRFGEVPTVAQATKNSFLDGLEGLLAKTPGSAGRFRDHVARTTANVRQNLVRMAQRGGDEALDSEAAGQAIVEGVGQHVGRFRGRAERLSDMVVAEIGEDTPVTVKNALGKLTELAKPVAGAEKTSQRFVSPFIRELGEDFAADVAETGTMPIGALRQIRSKVGEKLGSPSLISDVPTAQLKQLYGAISDDIGEAAKAAGPRAEKAYGLFNQFYRTRLGHIEKNLEPLVKNKTPERVFSSLMTASKQGPTQIRNIYKSLTNEQQDAVTGAVLRRLGTAPAGQQGAEGAEFSFSSFLTQWNQLDDAAKGAIFKRGRYAQLGQDINALARYSDRVKEASRAFFNPSGTSGATIGGTVGLLSAGSVLASPVLGAGALTLPLIFGGGAAAANAGARMMTSPRVVHWLAQATKLKPNGYGAHIGRLSALAAKETPEVQEAISDYLDILQAPQGEAEADSTLAADQPTPAAAELTPPVDPVEAMLADPSAADPQTLQTMALAEIVKSLRNQGQPSPQEQEIDPETTSRLQALEQERSRMAEQIAALQETGQVSGQQAAAMTALAEEQQQLLQRQSAAVADAASVEQALPAPETTSGGKTWTRKSATPKRDDQGRITEVEIVDEDEDGNLRTRIAKVSRDDFGRMTGLEVGKGGGS